MQDLSKVDKRFLRDLDNWSNAPVPVCMGGDPRALAWCCKPGYSLTFGFKCMRDKVLKDVGITSKEFMKIKSTFSKKHNWEAPETCFGSLTYCCMRNGGCHRRDAALSRVYSGMSYEKAKAEYFRLKQILAQEILKTAKNKKNVKPFLKN